MSKSKTFKRKNKIHKIKNKKRITQTLEIICP